MGGVCSIHRSDEIMRRFFRNLKGMIPLGEMSLSLEDNINVDNKAISML